MCMAEWASNHGHKNVYIDMCLCKAFKLILHYNIEQQNTMSGFLEFAPARFKQGPNVKNTALCKISKSYFLKTVRTNVYTYECVWPSGLQIMAIRMYV